MDLVATLIAGFETTLSHDLVKKIAGDKNFNWLAEGCAVDIFFDAEDIAPLRSEIAHSLKDETIDVIVQPTSARRKRMLAADMESTIIEQELLDELAQEIGVRAEVSAITHKAMNGELDFAAALRSRIELFKNQPTTLLDKIANLITFTPGASELVATMRANGAKTYLITGGFSYFAEPLALRLGFDESFANDLPLVEDRIAGTIKEPILDRFKKQHLLETLAAKSSIDLKDTLAVGDGANDVPMLAACANKGGLGVAYQAKPKVRAEIVNQINFCDLTALLYAQGYKKDAWVG